ncbi:hypothetical protein [Propionispira arboris]|uniref:hypothetical protein n=1 Tax=Propionispira arboris TaxID=84035 RepID=UPI000B87A5F5|nr:hypothetical protein [Propionispira arboris]
MELIEVKVGFSNDRSAEYMIINNLYEKTKKEYTLFYPFYYKKNRDDTNISHENKLDEAHFMICFARRPKTDAIYSLNSEITFRSSLFEHIKYFAQKGIDTIIGAPIGTSIESIGLGSTCCWFQLFPEQETEYLSCEFRRGKPYVEDDHLIKVLTEQNLKILMHDAPMHNWNEILGIIQDWNINYKMLHSGMFFNNMAGQKPIFLVYK